VSGTNVYAGGSFTQAGGAAANRVAMWNGQTWNALATGMDADVWALAVSGNDVYAGGSFTTAGGVAANRVAKWNGTSWRAVGTGMNGSIYSLAASGTDVYAGGYFRTAGGVVANNIAKWNGSAWSTLGTGLNSVVRELAVGNSGTVYAGGEFITVGDGSKVTAYFGIYRPQGIPTATVAPHLATQVKLYPNPASQTVFVELPADLRRTAHTAELVDGLGRVVRTQALLAGVRTQQLSLQGLGKGVYTLRVATAQGTVSKKLVVE
jgi:hypothetical protein